MTSVEGVPQCLLAAAPVLQPSHLEGDSSLATEVLPGPPSLQAVQHANLPKKDHKKTLPAVSYLPVSDPGTTYGGYSVSTMAASTEADGPRRKRARIDKSTASSRAQRASARNMAAVVPASDPPAPLEAVASTSNLNPDSDPLTQPLDSDDAMLSRSNSVQIGEDAENGALDRSSSRRREKGKGRERGAPVKVKEEPSTIPLSEPVAPNGGSNEDHCSSCRSLGSLVYCDGCPRAFHLWCLDPPMESQDLPAGDARWFCPVCTLSQKPPPKPPASLKFMAPLIDQIQHTIPVEYQLPQDIRTFFKDVATGPKGAYVDSSELKVPRLNRHGQLEDREPFRLKDRNGEAVLCFQCGTSALPPGVAASSPAVKRARKTNSPPDSSEAGRAIISCDYCHLHWHLDCLNPPLTFMPPWNRKWMCPNHVDHIAQPKRRIPKVGAPPIEITKPHQWNNGNIDVIHAEAATIPLPPRFAVDEVLINGRRYRVPERVITIDFWDKVERGHRPVYYRGQSARSSMLSSPLTELSSVGGNDEDDDEDVEEMTLGPPSQTFNVEEITAAMLLCGLHLGTVSTGPSSSKIPALRNPYTDHKSNVSLANHESEGDMKMDVDTDNEAHRMEKVDHAKPHRSRVTRSTLKVDVDTVEPVPQPQALLEGSIKSQINGRESVKRPRRASPRNAQSSGQSSTEGVTAPTPDLIEAPASASTSSRPKRERKSAKPTKPVVSNGSPIVPDVAPDSAPTSHTLRSHTTSTNVKHKATPKNGRQPKPATPSQSPDINAAVSAPPSAAPASVPVAKETTTPSSGLKIRLPRLSGLNLSSSPAKPVEDTSHSKSQSSSNARTSRRSLRRQTTSTPLSSIDNPSSP